MALAGLLAGCGRAPMPHPPEPPLQTATLQELVARFNQNANAVQTMTLKLNLSVKTTAKKYPKLSTYLLTQKPSDIRISGSITLLGRIFDMASDGSRFEVNIPPDNQFVVGRNDVIPAETSNPLEKLRPQVILNALLTNPIAPTQHVAFDPDESTHDYDLLVIAPGDNGVDHLVRRITFSRYDLLPHRQVIYDGDQIHATVAEYSHFVLLNDIAIPLDMNLERPVEGYALHLQIASNGVTLNKPFTTANPFELQPPAGSRVVKISER